MKFVCKICGYSCSFNYSGTHLKKKHGISGKEYYDKYIKKDGEGICKICSNHTSFYTIKMGYKETCSVSCANKLKNLRLFESTGATNFFQLEAVKAKATATNIKKLGVANPSQSETVKNKKKKTLMKNYGVEYGLQSPEIKSKQEASMIEKYGTKQAMHCPELVQKAIDNGGGKVRPRKYITKFGDSITVQGSYEEKFVKLCEEADIRILNGPMLKYQFEEKERRYFVDFYIIQNGNHRLVEIKSSYYYKRYQKQVEAKSKAAIAWSQKQGYLPYVLMIDNISIELILDE